MQQQFLFRMCCSLARSCLDVRSKEKERERKRRGKKRRRGEGVAQGADDVVVMHSKTLLLSLSIKSTKNRTRRKQCPAGKGIARDRAEVWGVPHSGLATFFTFLLLLFVQKSYCPVCNSLEANSNEGSSNQTKPDCPSPYKFKSQLVTTTACKNSCRSLDVPLPKFHGHSVNTTFAGKRH